VPERIWQGRFNIVGGNVQEDGPYASAITDRTVAESVVDLYLVLQPMRSDPDQICAEVMRTVTRIFGRAQYSVTGNLLLALGKAHQHLREWNRASLAEHRLEIGVCCVAIAGNEAYVALAGPGTLFYRHNGRTERIEPIEEQGREPLGDGEVLLPSFHRLSLIRGDALLLLSGRLGQRADPQQVGRCLALDPETGLPEVFRLARGEADCGAVLLSVLDELTPEDEDSGGEANELERFRAHAQQPSPITRVAPPSRIRFPVLEGPPMDRLLEEPPVGERRLPFSPFGRSPLRRVDAVHPDEGSGTLRVLGSEKPRPPLSGPRNVLSTPEEVIAAAKAVSQQSVRVRSTPPSFRNAFARLDGPRRSWRPYLFGGAAVAALALLVAVGIPALSSVGGSQRFQSLLRSSQSELASAQSQSDLSRRRELLNQALSNADEAKRLKPGDPQADSQLTRAQGAITVMDAVYTLPDVPQIADLSNAGLSPSSAVELAAGDRLYVLDVASGKVLAASRDGNTPPDAVYEEGSDVDGVRAGKAHHIAWQPPANASDPGTLLILDAGRNLFGLSRGTLRAIPLRGVDQWRSDTAMAFGNGGLYILDAKAATVWRYAPSDSGFASEPAPAVARTDIADASGISVVGGVFLTGQDSRIRRFLGGQESGFKLAGIDRQPAAPQPPLYDATTGSLYIADRGNSRVVVLEGDGRFKRQLVHAKLAGLRGVAVDGDNNRLIGVIGQSLVAIPLPK
jgi:hypothetical protein